MASRKMTFTIPEELAAEFVRQVPRDRSGYVAEAIAAKLHERKERMVQACEVANNSSDVLAIEREWDSLIEKSDLIAEPWNIAPPR